ncbi:LysR family transcriptional regulator [Mycolicibacterium sp. BiH015]|uniref:LysR family transcriptional regulator n=1 Tax=Mycolicibacterium sp. BiH015 TaxID=3018808 RepID=UPI0022E94333|nr:LysR family transcriptional regulator [Mycolicibacterium sp. BiH015]MDA2889982.1 LysR family transcriptional regulator [Mycolicibacterium sp. BiH015]
MHVMHTLRADLNLIPALAVLLDERHISRSATRLGLSQPATSRALQRLRNLLGDELLVRDRDGYRLTARAQVLHTQLAEVLPALEALVSPDSFDPASASARVDIAGTDFAVHTYGAAICARLTADSPDAPIRFHSWRFETAAEQIHRGSVDLGLFGGFMASDLTSSELLTERFVCVADADHPTIESGLSLDDYCRLRHLVVDVADGIQPDVDLPLRALGRQRTPAVTVPYHSAVPLILVGTGLVATIPESLANLWPPIHRVRIVPAPREFRRLPYRMIWHPAYDNDRRHRWLRSAVRAAVRGSATNP